MAIIGAESTVASYPPDREVSSAISKTSAAPSAETPAEQCRPAPRPRPAVPAQPTLGPRAQGQRPPPCGRTPTFAPNAPPASEPAQQQRGYWLAALLLFVIALLAGTSLALHAFGNSKPGDAAGPPSASSVSHTQVNGGSKAPIGGAAQRAAAMIWASRSLSREAVIVGDAASIPTLRSLGFRLAVSFENLRARPEPTLDYVLDIPATVPSYETAAGGARARLVRLSLPLAVFGTGATAATMREILPDGTEAMARKRADNADVQKTAGRELVRNAELVLDSATKTALLSGKVDLRVENVLSELASMGLVYVSDPQLDPAEARAGQPVRSVVISTRDQRATQSMLSSMIAPYRPETMQLISPQKLRLTWQPAIAPATSVGN